MVPLALLALLAIAVAGTSSAQAAEPEINLEWCQAYSGEGEGCPPDQCPEAEGYQVSESMCPAPEPQPEPQPQPTPAPAPAPVDLCPEVEGLQTDSAQCLPDEAPAPGIDVEVSSLTLQGVQHDPPATVGPEEFIPGESDSPATVAGAGTGAVVTPTGALPYTGLTVDQLAALGGLLLLAGAASWRIGSRRRATAAA